MPKKLPNNKVRFHEVKVRFSDEELELAKIFHNKYRIPKSVLLRELYMNKVREVIKEAGMNDCNAV